MRESVSATIVISGAIILFSCLGVFSKAAIQIQPSLDGRLEASLTQAKLSENVFTVKVTLRNLSREPLEMVIPLRNFYVITREDRKRYYPLQDAKGVIAAGPRCRYGDGDIFRQKLRAGERMSFWVNFPPLPEIAQTADLYVPGMLPFEAVVISRDQG